MEKETFLDYLPEWLVLLSGLFYKSDRYKHLVRVRAEELVKLRHELCNKHVRIQDVLRKENGGWNRYQYISMDGVEVCPYTEEEYSYLCTLRERYYKLHKHTILANG